MGYWEAVLLGLIQGLTEFLPISSSGHLALGRLLFDFPDENAKAFDVLVHVATLLVVFIGFGRVFLAVLTKYRNLWPRFIVALIPTGVVGIFLKDYIESLDRDPIALAVLFAVTGLTLLSLKWFAKDRPNEPEEVEESSEEKKPEGAEVATGGMDLNRICWSASIWVGLGQALAILPGISRSGMTIAAARLRGVPPEEAIAFSFILAAPAILGALVLKAKDIQGLADASLGPVSAGFVAAAISGWFALRVLRWLALRKNLSRFAPYCFLLSGLCVYAAFR